MERRIEDLLEKYWLGETSLEEEKELKSLISEAPAYAEEKAFFSGIDELTSIKPGPLSLPERQITWFRNWKKIAALLFLFLVSGSLWYAHWQRQAQARAYEQVMEAFMLINANMQLATNSLEVLDDFRYLNTAQEIFNQDKETYEKVD